MLIPYMHKNFILTQKKLIKNEKLRKRDSGRQNASVAVETKRDVDSHLMEIIGVDIQIFCYVSFARASLT